MCLDAKVEAPQPVAAQRVSTTLQHNARRPVEVNGLFDDRLEEETVALEGREEVEHMHALTEEGRHKQCILKM